MRIAFITGHAPQSKRKTGFHFWAKILAERGVKVEWVTVGFSHLTVMKDKGKVPPPPYNQWTPLSPNIAHYSWCPVFHPINLKKKILNALAIPFFNLYPALMPHALVDRLEDCDVFIVDSGAALMLVPKLAELCPYARFVYFASDRLSTLRAHPAIVAAEKKALPYISLIRVIAENRIGDYPSHKNVHYIPQGIDREFFDAPHTNPYQKPHNIVCAGDMLFDAESVAIMARLLPDWTIHLFGKGATMPEATANIIEHGEQPFETLVPYIKYADLGLAPYAPSKGGDYFAQSGLKIAQYTYFQLPVVVPDMLRTNIGHLISYVPHDEVSISAALQAAIAFDRHKIDKGLVPDWNDIIDAILDYAQKEAA